MSHRSVSVVIPVYNEQDQVLGCLERIKAYYDLLEYDYEIIVSSDGSVDGTVDLAQKWFEAHPQVQGCVINASRNTGKGRAVALGVERCSKAFVLMSDVDLSSPIKESQKLFDKMDAGYDVAIGSRVVSSKKGLVIQSFKRHLSGRIFNLCVKTVLLTGVEDTQCGFKCFRLEVAKKIFSRMSSIGFSFDVEVLYLATADGLKVSEVPVMWTQGRHSKVRFFKDSFGMLSDVLKMRARYQRRLCVRGL